ncbi:hypothetical protein GGTG_08572 [Gaeumannomyces tritici R3-111a-1]|uniref:Uncharacterized protein n=1 Tax=Gaeumannomyces tritici (strain R3-111a-1) TaxID=644352 RepID=J3P4Y6_GAET3|nr:hypothetical protein GGTG_08572 [Gaeumannomyces tritici R3-111a-1]EJT74734.1 hypothetical protein GGTG_08572 [Gaeumannomyces tritici R3-111a-1]
MTQNNDSRGASLFRILLLLGALALLGSAVPITAPDIGGLGAITDGSLTDSAEILAAALHKDQTDLSRRGILDFFKKPKNPGPQTPPPSGPAPIPNKPGILDGIKNIFKPKPKPNPAPAPQTPPPAGPAPAPKKPGIFDKIKDIFKPKPKPNPPTSNPPTNNSPANNPPANNPPAANPKYPSGGELTAIKADVQRLAPYSKPNQPPADKSVFFTGTGGAQKSNQIKAAIKKEGLTHLGMIWKEQDNFLVRKNYRAESQPAFDQLIRDISKFFANRTKGKRAYLVMSHRAQAARNSIFWSVELDELINGNHIDTIVWLDTDKVLTDPTYDWNAETEVYWQRGKPKPPGV